MRVFHLIWFMALLSVGCTSTKELTGVDLKQTELRSKHCINYLLAKRKFNDRSKFGLSEEGGHIFFSAGSKNFYNAVFQNDLDGIAIQMVSREKYSCDSGSADNSGYADRIWKVITKPTLDTLQNISYYPEKILLDLGPLPTDYDPLTNENNLIIVQKKYDCGNTTYFNLERNSWDLLEMGIFKDSVRMTPASEAYSLNEKSLEFTVQYEKNDATIDDRDLQPIYDSLDFTEYDIVSINIVAFASIEGDKSLNEKLVKRRSKAVVEALQKYQKPEIIYQIDAMENWDQFYSEIKKTAYKDLAEKDRSSLKAMFKGNENNLAKFEPLLARHRKAIIKIFLSRKEKVENLPDEELISIFNDAVKEDDLERVKLLLDYVLNRFADTDNPENFISRLEIPAARNYGPLLNNINGFRYLSGYDTDDESLSVFEELHRIFPLNKEILYNLIAIKMINLKGGINKSDLKKMRVLLDQLQISALEPRLKYRPWINYYILSNEYYHQINDFPSSRRMIRNILSIYKNILTYEDRLKIAKYLANYSQYTEAEKILRPVIENEDIPDELLFYYLNFTVPFSRYYKEPYYTGLVNRAITKDREKFCGFYRSANDSGVSFQLLERAELKSIYCDKCTN